MNEDQSISHDLFVEITDALCKYCTPCCVLTTQGRYVPEHILPLSVNHLLSKQTFQTLPFESLKGNYEMVLELLA